ncbi:MAG: UDP-N-acetylmuramyl-tripeptide synthetase, partial [Phascolarctobacterium sp.]|nr:UDP-N-acetylmuramyl-tripeptide synthetase [Phascolarctobacterium sp.]
MQKQLTLIIDKIIEEVCQVQVLGADDKIITDITADSRVVEEGSLFICLKGATVDGHKFLQMAVEKGAVAALVEDVPEEIPEGVTLLVVPDTRKAMEAVVPYFYDYPGKNMRMLGITGTNGKTTTTNIIRTVLRRAGYKVGLIGTINIMIEDEVTEAHNTTPDVVDLQKALYAMKNAGCDYVVMEVSSHALVLNRVAGCEYDCAVLTNITQDHLDFHKTIENYRDAKSLLFEGLANGTKENKNAVFNMDDASSEIIKARTKVNCLTYGKGHDNDIYPISFDVQAKEMALQLATPVGEMNL